MSKTDCSASGKTKCTPVCLLLFVGFIFGFSVGFGTHDAIHKTLSKALYGGGSALSEPITKVPSEEGLGETEPAEEKDEAPEVVPEGTTQPPQVDEKKVEGPVEGTE